MSDASLISILQKLTSNTIDQQESVLRGGFRRDLRDREVPFLPKTTSHRGTKRLPPMILIPSLYHPCSEESRILSTLTASPESRRGQTSFDSTGEYRLEERHFIGKTTLKMTTHAQNRCAVGTRQLSSYRSKKLNCLVKKRRIMHVSFTRLPADGPGQAHEDGVLRPIVNPHFSTSPSIHEEQRLQPNSTGQTDRRGRPKTGE